MEEKNIGKDNIKSHFNGVGRNIMNLITWLNVRTSGKHLSTDSLALSFHNILKLCYIIGKILASAEQLSSMEFFSEAYLGE